MRLGLCGCALKMSASIIVCSLLVISTTFQFVHHLDFFSCQSWIDFRTLNTINPSNTIDTITTTSQTSKISQFQWLNHSLQFVRHLNHFWCQSWIDFKSGIVQEEREPFLPILLVWVKLYFCRSGFKNFCPTIQQKVYPALYSDYQNCFLPFSSFFCCVFRKCVCAAAEFVWICFDETFSWRVGMQMSLSASCDEGRYKDQLSFKTNSTNTNENTNRNTDAERVPFENKWISINVAAIEKHMVGRSWWRLIQTYNTYK